MFGLRPSHSLRSLSIYFDSRLAAAVDERHRLEFLAAYYSLMSEPPRTGGVVTYKARDLEPGAGSLDFERGGVAATTFPKWQTDDSIDRNSWSWVEPADLKNATELVGELVDTVAKGGTLLLNVGPKADGTFDPRVEGTLLTMGGWLGINGVGVYGSVPWDVCCEGPTNIVPGFNNEFPMFGPTDFRFTASESAIFVFAMAPAAVYKVSTLNWANAANVTDVTLVGGSGKVVWQLAEGGMTIKCPECADSANFTACEGCPRGLPRTFRLHLGGSTTEEIDAPTRSLRARITEGV